MCGQRTDQRRADELRLLLVKRGDQIGTSAGSGLCSKKL